jgi:L-iditol 2-dehydrogenase
MAGNHKMKAAVVPTQGRFVVCDVPDPICPDDGVVLRVGAATICASDLKRSVRDDLAQPRPYILGEEAAGTIATVGRKVTKWKIGDRVAFASRIFCGKCLPCRAGQTNHCRDVRGLGWHVPGGFAEYCAVPDGFAANECLVKLPDDMPFEAAALAEPVACALNGVEMAAICKGDDVVIIGMGAQGVLQAQLARHFGARTVIGVMRSARRSEVVRRFATALDELVISSDASPLDALKKHTNGEGATVVLVSASSGEALKLSLELVRFRGRICVHASIPGGEQMLQADANRIHYDEITITGSSSFKQRHYTEALKLLHQRIIDADKLISCRLPLAEIERGVAMMKNREALKVAILP